MLIKNGKDTQKTQTRINNKVKSLENTLFMYALIK